MIDCVSLGGCDECCRQKFLSMKLGVIWFVFHILHVLLMRFTEQNLCCISKSTMEHLQNWIENRTSPGLVMVMI